MAVTARKFFKTVISITVLSEYELPPDIEIADVVAAITDGDCSGQVDMLPAVTMDGRTAAGELRAQGSDPGFFQLTDEGEDVDD